MRTCRYAVCLGLSLSLLGCVATDAPSDEPSDPPDVASLTTPEVARVRDVVHVEGRDDLQIVVNAND